MALKSKTQRAKRSAARAAKKQQATLEAERLANQPAAAEEKPAEEPKKAGLFKKADSQKAAPAAPAKKEEKKPEKKAKKPGFLSQVRSEMRRVTWPTRTDVLRWSGVVVVALLFFGIFVAVLDNFIVTPLLVGISGLSGLGA